MEWVELRGVNLSWISFHLEPDLMTSVLGCYAYISNLFFFLI